MADYRVTFADSAKKEYEQLPAGVKRRVTQKIDGLEQYPRGLWTKKLRGWENHYRIRIGDYRVVFQVFERERVVDISLIRHRSEAYR
jgi:mRNA interferase RelE/StbE